MKNVTMQITDEKAAILKETAEKRGTSIASLMKDATDISLNFDPFFLSMVRDFSATLKVPEYIVIQNIGIAWFARYAAESETSDFRELGEFRFTGKGPITGKELFEDLKARYQNELAAQGDSKRLK